MVYRGNVILLYTSKMKVNPPVMSDKQLSDWITTYRPSYHLYDRVNDLADTTWTPLVELRLQMNFKRYGLRARRLYVFYRRALSHMRVDAEASAMVFLRWDFDHSDDSVRDHNNLGSYFTYLSDANYHNLSDYVRDTYYVLGMRDTRSVVYEWLYRAPQHAIIYIADA